MHRNDKADLQGTLILLTATILFTIGIIVASFLGASVQRYHATQAIQKELVTEWCDEKFCYNETYNTERCYTNNLWKKYNCTTLNATMTI